MADRYWVGGSGTWNTTSTTNWSTTSGGTGGASVPTAADSVFFDQSTTFTVTMTGALTCLDFNVTAGTVTFATGTTPTLAISGNLNITGVTPTWNSTGTITFNSTTAKTIRSNNTIFGGNVTFDGVGGTWQLLDNLTVGTNVTLRITTLTNGTLDLNDFVLATPFFNSTNSNVRGINFRNSSKIQVTYNAGTAGQRQWDCTTATNLTLSYVNDPLVEFPNVGTTQAYCGVSHASGAGGSESVAISLLISNGSIPFTTNNGAEHFRNVTFSDSYSGTVQRLGSIYGNMVLSANATYRGITNINFAKSTGTQTFTTKNKVFAFPIFKINAGTLQLIGDLDTGTQTLTLTSGTFDLNNYISRNSIFRLSGPGAKTIAFGTGKIQCTNTTATGAIFGGPSSQALLTCTGSKQVEFTGNGFNRLGYRQFACSGVTEANALNLKMTAGGGKINIFNGSTLTNIELAGGESGSSIAFQPNCIVYGNITIEAIAANPSISPSSSASSFTLGKTSGTQTIQMNGTACDLSMTKTGAGMLQLANSLTLLSARTFTLTAGTLDLNGFTLNAGDSFSTGVGTKSILFNNGTLLCPASSTTAFNNAQPTGFTTYGYGIINMTSSTAATFVGGNTTYSCDLNIGGAGPVTITGSNGFNAITNSVQPCTLVLTAGTTQTVNRFALSGTEGNVVSVTSTSSPSVATLSKQYGTTVGSYISLTDITATGGATWYVGTTSTASNSTGWIAGAGISNRLTNTGVMTTAGLFDEVSSSTSKLAPNATFASEFDEVTINGSSGGLAKRVLFSGTVQVTGSFDETASIG